MYQKILTDVDGVLLNWEEKFDIWKKEKNVEYSVENVRRFNESAWIGTLNPFRDAVQVLIEFAIHNYHFEAITSLGTDIHAANLRRDNLRHHFGEVIRRCYCLEVHAPKNEILKEFTPTWFVDDKPEQCEAGVEAGHSTIIMDHERNRWYSNPDVIRVENWAEIKEIIFNGK